jgi:hypothetical protein
VSRVATKNLLQEAFEGWDKMPDTPHDVTITTSHHISFSGRMSITPGSVQVLFQQNDADNTTVTDNAHMWAIISLTDAVANGANDYPVVNISTSNNQMFSAKLTINADVVRAILKRTWNVPYVKEVDLY